MILLAYSQENVLLTAAPMLYSILEDHWAGGMSYPPPCLTMSQKKGWLAVRRTRFQNANCHTFRRMRLWLVLSPWLKYKPMRLFPRRYGKPLRIINQFLLSLCPRVAHSIAAASCLVYFSLFRSSSPQSRVQLSCNKACLLACASILSWGLITASFGQLLCVSCGRVLT